MLATTTSTEPTNQMITKLKWLIRENHAKVGMLTSAEPTREINQLIMNGTYKRKELIWSKLDQRDLLAKSDKTAKTGKTRKFLFVLQEQLTKSTFIRPTEKINNSK